MSVILLNVNVPFKGQGYPIGKRAKSNYISKSDSKRIGEKKRYHGKTNEEEAGTSVLITDKMYF